ncbi:MAG: aldolase [Patescibacteria group bacterium]
MTDHIHVPGDVPASMKDTYIANYQTATRNSGNLLLFAGDQKIEHLNDDFYGEGITPENANPQHLFEIASQAKIGVFASQYGLISRFGRDYPDVPYMVKLNSKTHLIPTEQSEAISRQFTDFHMIDELKKNLNISIVGVGYTIYVGSENETFMFEEAARIAFEAHQRGMIAVFWMYPRGKAVPFEKDPHIIAGAAGVGACLGADFVKVNYPVMADHHNMSQAEALREAVQAAGRTKVICAGGSTIPAEEYFQVLHDQLHISGAHGTAAGRNIHQRSVSEALKFCDALHALIVEGKTVEEATAIYKG